MQFAASYAKRSGNEDCPEAVAAALLAGAFHPNSVVHNLMPAIRTLHECGTTGQQELYQELLLKMPLIEGIDVLVDKREVDSKGPTYK
jgi:hypothetical protein